MCYLFLQIIIDEYLLIYTLVFLYFAFILRKRKKNEFSRCYLLSLEAMKQFQHYGGPDFHFHTSMEALGKH